MKVTEIHPLAGVLDFDPHYFTGFVEIKNDLLLNFLSIDARDIAKLDAERVRIRIVFETHGFIFALRTAWKGVMTSG